MTKLVDIQTITVAVASASVMLGVFYYALQIRHQNRTRDTDLMIRLYSTVLTDQWQASYLRVMSAEFKDYADFTEKYGSWISENPLSIAAHKVSAFYGQLGSLLQRRLVNPDLLFEQFSIIEPWERLRPIIEGARKQLNQPGLYHGFEYLYNELQKRETSVHSTA